MNQKEKEEIRNLLDSASQLDGQDYLRLLDDARIAHMNVKYRNEKDKYPLVNQERQ